MASESLDQRHGRLSGVALQGTPLDAAVAVLSLFLMAGIAFDANAHASGGLSFAEEGFLTPSHVFFYTAFLGIAAVLGVATVRRRMGGADWLDAIPAGYGVGLLGVIIFGFGGVGDFLWHSTFGFETGVEALTSPSHLMLGVGGVLFLSSPLRSTWQREGTPTGLGMVPALVSATLALSLFVLFASLLNPATNPAVFSNDFFARQIGVAGFMIFPGLLVAVALHMARRFELPPGGVTLLFAGPALISAAVGVETGSVLLVAAFLVTGLVGDLLVRLVPPTGGLSTRLFGTAVGLAFGGSYLAIAILAVDHPVAWSVHIWTGAVVLSALSGLVMSFVAVPDTTREVRA